MMTDMPLDEVQRRAQLAFIKASRKAIALAEATNTLVIARGFDEVPGLEAYEAAKRASHCPSGKPKGD